MTDFKSLVFLCSLIEQLVPMLKKTFFSSLKIISSLDPDPAKGFESLQTPTHDGG